MLRVRRLGILNTFPRRQLHYARDNRILLRKAERHVVTTHRPIATVVARAIGRQLLRLRTYVIAGGAAGTTAAVNKYEEWRSKLPEFGLGDETVQRIDDLKKRLDELKLGAQKVAAEGRDRIAGIFSDNGWMVPLYEHLSDTGERWENIRREWAAKRAELERQREEARSKMVKDSNEALAASARAETTDGISQAERNEKLQQELMEIQAKYQREIEALEKEVKELKKQLLLRMEKADAGKRRKMKKSLIDMYSEVLDELSCYDSSYNVQDNLPRVVVVGDQSSGKTSVLEMIAQARIFPRGAGEMMTRAPVKVTLSEGPYHIAQFKDSTREFDLTKESDLEALRREIEHRMRNSVKQGRTISTDVIALTVKGSMFAEDCHNKCVPGANMPRMVLVDLPGIISTVTTGMAPQTRDDIQNMCKHYMENPNAIILCIQDGSVDAERSNVTDLVSSMDPTGRRTIMVLTKVDLAEQNLADPMRIKRILEGRLFPMKALGYFAVVTGRGNTKDSIETIRQYEEQFFANSKLFTASKLKTTQMTTRNMSMAVSECFWRMVKESVVQQADAFRATRFNLETEWKNNFPRVRELDREELFDKARSEILDEIVNLDHISVDEWERKIHARLIEKIGATVFENIYMPSMSVQSVGAFNTAVDIKLRQWTERELPETSIKVGWELMREVFADELNNDNSNKARADRDTILNPLKTAVLTNAFGMHRWDVKATEYLRVLQTGALEEHDVVDKKQWDTACLFMRSMVTERMNELKKVRAELLGPSWTEQWLKWKTPTEEQLMRRDIEAECERIVSNREPHGINDKRLQAKLSDEDLTVIKRNLEAAGATVPRDELIRDTWHHFYRLKFLEHAEAAAIDCRSYYFHYKRGFDTDDALECAAIPLFHRISRVAQATAVALRQQITNTEQRRLQKEIRETLDEWSSDEAKKKELLVGRRVQLAEELKQVRAIQDKLEEFIEALNSGAKP